MGTRMRGVESSARTFRIGFRLRAKLGFLAATATLAVLASTAWVTLHLFRAEMLSLLEESSSHQSDVLRVVLEEQMLAANLAPLRRIVADLGREPNIEWVAVINAEGRVRITSDPRMLDVVVDRGSPDCRVCHALAPGRRSRSVTLVHEGGSVLRTTTPFLNRPACHRCHGEEARMNGVLVVDRTLGPLERAVVSSRAQVVAGSAAAVFALLATLGFAVERLVLSRLRRLREAARELGRGNLGARARDLTADELGDLTRDFNAMAEGLEGALERLGAERRQLHEIVDGISDGIVLLDDGLKLVVANRAFAGRLPPGVTPAQGTPYGSLARAAGFEGADGSSSVAQRALASERLEKEIVRVSSGPDRERTEEIYALVLRDEDGGVTGVIEVWRDITDRMELEAGLEQSERLAAIGMLASGIAHEVGNPLAAIATAVEGLLRRLDGPGADEPRVVKEYLEIVRKQVFRLRDVTERLLGFARVPSRQLTLVDAAAAAREVLALVAHQARAQGVDVRAALEGPVHAVAEPLLLEQALLNLVLNALQAMPRGGTLGVEARAEGETVLVSVEDTGHGIPEPVRRRLFEPFLRGRPDGAGTGLGLFLTQALLRRVDGAISVESDPGRGARFTVRLKAPRGGSLDSTGGA